MKTMNNNFAACPLCSSNLAEELIEINRQQTTLMNEITHIRNTGNKTIKYMSELIDRLAELKQQQELLFRSM